MRAIKLVLSFSVLLAVSAGIPTFLSAEITNRIVARVNSDVITLHELNGAIKRFIGVSAKDLQRKNDAKFYEVRRTVLDNLINEKIARQEIVKLGIKVTAKDIDEAIERVKSDTKLTHEELLYRLNWEETTFEEFRERLRQEIERSRLVTHEVKSKIVITEENVREYYQKHVKEFVEIPAVRLARIFLQVRDPGDKEEIAHVKDLGREIVTRLKEGRDFSEMAKIYSQCPAAAEGGGLGWIELNQIEPRLRKKIAQLFPGQHTNLQLAPSGFQIIMLIEEKKGGVKPLEEVSDSIHSKLFKEKVEERYARWIKKLRDKSFIKVIF